MNLRREIDGHPICVDGNTLLKIGFDLIAMRPWCKFVAEKFAQVFLHFRGLRYYYGTDIPSELLDQRWVCIAGKCPCFARTQSSEIAGSESLSPLVREWLEELE